MRVTYTALREFTRYQLVVLKRAVRTITSEPIEFVRVDGGGKGVLGFGVESEYTTLSPSNISFLPTAERILSRDLREYLGLPPEKRLEPVPRDWNKPYVPKVLYFDIETHSADERWDLTPREFFRLGQYAWGARGEVTLTVDYDEMISAIREADLVVGHNIQAFDLSALFGTDSTEPLEMARDGKVLDTFVFAQMALPAPTLYVNSAGRKQKVTKPEETMRWFSLDNLAFQLDVTGKIGDLKAMAKKYGGFCHIPLVLSEFIDYARQDVVALQEITHELLSLKSMDDYDWREQEFAGVCAQISRNGFKVDVAKATARRDELADRKEELLSKLVAEYDFPSEGKKPWVTKAGKAAIFKILEDNGITEDTVPDWPRTETGNLSLGGKVLLEITQGTAAEEMGVQLAELAGQRSLAQLALDSVHSDGFTHPELSFLQRSGRTSVQKPGLTVWSAHGAKAIEKSYFVPDSEDELLVEMDFSNADGRIVAAYSGDKVFLERMEEDFDSHELSGRLLFGDELYDSDVDKYRQASKPASHGWAYKAGTGAIMRSTKVAFEQAKNFIDGMNTRYADVLKWQNKVIRKGESGQLTNDWGRVMIVEKDRSFTQSPALMGQSGTREIMVDALLRMLHHGIQVVKWLKVTVHDAIVFSIPKKDIDWGVPLCRSLMETEWQPKDGSGQLIQFPVSAGTPATDWQKAGH